MKENFARDFSVALYFFIHLFLHNLCALNSNLSDTILYLVTVTFKLAEHKMATKMLRKPNRPIFYDLSHIKGQFMVSAIFLIDNFFLYLWEERTFI